MFFFLLSNISVITSPNFQFFWRYTIVSSPHPSSPILSNIPHSRWMSHLLHFIPLLPGLHVCSPTPDLFCAVNCLYHCFASVESLIITYVNIGLREGSGQLFCLERDLVCHIKRNVRVGESNETLKKSYSLAVIITRYLLNIRAITSSFSASSFLRGTVHT